MPRMKRNFVVKTIDGKVGGIQKALKAAGIDVLSVIEVYKEELPAEAAEPAGGEPAAVAAEQTVAAKRAPSTGAQSAEGNAAPPAEGAAHPGETPPSA